MLQAASEFGLTPSSRLLFYLGGLCSVSEENHRLFRRMQKYIETNYETKYLKKVYISGDCGAWIKAYQQSSRPDAG